uniref:Uncharacterized protein n=1 Tax=Ciona savignyi TaxID=51511 RepID=H2YZV3_CIOSA
SKAPVRVNDNINTGCCLNSLKKNRNFRITSKICLYSQTPEDGYIRVSALHSSENDRKGNFTLNRPSAIDDVHPSTGAINSDVTHLIYNPKNNSWETERRNNLRTAPTVNDGLQAPLPSRDIGNEAVRHSGGRIVASYRQGSSVFRLISDKTAKKGTDTVRLEVTRFQKTGQKSTDVIYRVPTSLATSDEQIVEYNPVD